jgi:hypothetical protein
MGSSQNLYQCRTSEYSLILKYNLADIIKIRHSGSGWVLNRRGEDTVSQTGEDSHVKTGEIAVMLPQTKECQELPENTRI